MNKSLFYFESNWILFLSFPATKLRNKLEINDFTWLKSKTYPDTFILKREHGVEIFMV